MSKYLIHSAVAMALLAASSSSFACGRDWRDPMAAEASSTSAKDQAQTGLTTDQRRAFFDSIKPILDPSSGRPIGYIDPNGNTHKFPTAAQQYGRQSGERSALSSGGLYDCGGVMEIAGGGLWSGLAYTYATRSPDFWIGLLENQDRNNTQKLVDELNKKKLECFPIAQTCQESAKKNYAERRDACPGTKVKIGNKLWEIELESGAACIAAAQWLRDRHLKQCDEAYLDCMLGK